MAHWAIYEHYVDMCTCHEDYYLTLESSLLHACLIISVRGLQHPNKSKKAPGAVRRPAFHPLPCLHHQQWFLETPRERGVTHTLSQAHPHRHQNRRRRRNPPKRVSLKVETQWRMTQAMMVQLYISGTFFTFSF